MIAGLPFNRFLPPHASTLLRIAKHNLIHNYDSFGVLEDSSMFYGHVAQLMGWKYTEIYNQSKKTKHRPGVTSLSLEEINTLRKSLDLDLKLYQFAKDYWNDKTQN